VVRLLADENLNHAVLRGVRLRRRSVDVLRAQDVGLSGKEDPVILEWAAVEGRVLLTHDAASMPFHAFQRLRAGREVSGVCVVPRGAPLSSVIDDIVLIAECSDNAEWQGVVRYLPL
jgi:hypothetical protein